MSDERRPEPVRSGQERIIPVSREAATAVMLELLEKYGDDPRGISVGVRREGIGFGVGIQVQCPGADLSDLPQFRHGVPIVVSVIGPVIPRQDGFELG